MKKSLFLLLLTASGCTLHFADVTAISTREIHAKHIDLEKMQTSRNIEGETTTFCSIFTPWLHPKLSDAVDDALLRGDGDLLINGDIFITHHFALIGTVCSIKIKGDVVNLKKPKDS